MKRRDLLALSVSLCTGLLLPAGARAETGFERYQRLQREGAASIQQEWIQYRQAYLAAYKDYQNRLGRVWSRPELSDKKVWVEYDNRLQTRRVVDFEHNEVRLSFTGDDAARLSEARIRAEFEKVVQASIRQSYQQDPLLNKVAGSQPPSSSQGVSGIRQADIDALLRQAKQQQQNTSKGKVITVTIPLQANALPARAHSYLPLVQSAATKWQISPALVMAIMQTESAFNPMAQSHVPAFGLMQIVPGSAGRDASKKVYGKERLLSGAELFKPQTNIELGCAYLHILDRQYLNAVTDPQSRLYCVIAAYNTGAGNVARAFSGNTSVKDAARRINAMSPKQVYAHLRTQLKYEETRNYVQKVTAALAQYQGQ
jgi:membrane-bound lytic murein transglycosylase C